MVLTRVELPLRTRCPACGTTEAMHMYVVTGAAGEFPELKCDTCQAVMRGNFRYLSGAVGVRAGAEFPGGVRPGV